MISSNMIKFLPILTPLLLTSVTAFPALANINADHIGRRETNCGPNPCNTFNAEEQYVDVSAGGANPFIAPSSTDIRGPCPGLNAASNHGFLPRNGVVSFDQTVQGLKAAYVMGEDLAAGLAAYAIAFDGDVATRQWSIGGPFPGKVAGLINTNPEGISYSHNNYESDMSAGRFDAYLNNGDAHSLDLEKFTHLYETGTEYTFASLQDQFAYNQNLSETTNPYFFSGAFSGLIVAPAAHYFIINFMSNHSAEQPNGYLDQNTLKQFFAVTGEPGNFTWLPGQERIPENWYRRSTADPYDIPRAVADVLTGYKNTPSTFKIGGNIGEVNSFLGVDPGDLTSNVYSAETLFEGNNFACFAFQVSQQLLPDVLGGLLTDVTPALSLVNDNLFTPALSGLGCPQLDKINQSLFNKYPGYKYNPTGTDQSF